MVVSHQVLKTCVTDVIKNIVSRNEHNFPLSSKKLIYNMKAEWTFLKIP